MATPITNLNEGLWRYGGMYGAALAPNGELHTDVVEVTGATEVNRIDVPLVGSTKQGYKPGRESREGNLRIQKIDTEWEMRVVRFLSQNLEQRRALRDQGLSALDPFTIDIEVDDPDALGVEKWTLEGCIIWRLPLGFNITDDIMDREFPLTWEKETPVYAFQAKKDGAGRWYADYEEGFEYQPVFA